MSGLLMVGKTVSSYDIVAKAGEGGMGVVYRARDRRLGREVALKFLFPEMLRSLEARTRFEREARLISSISHPNVATLFSCEDSEDGTFLVFEYLPGGTLADRMPRRKQALPPVSLARGIAWAVQIADGLAHAHRKGIVHRDIKPANVLFDADDRPKLSDFGLAKAERDVGVTRAGSTVGTAAYMAPEQAIGADASPCSDIYSFGVLLYELFAGQRPFATDDPRGAFFHILESQPEAPRTARPDLPETLNILILRLIAKRPSERPGTMDEVLAELKQIQAVIEASGQTATATSLMPVSLPELDKAMVTAAAGAKTPKWRWLMAGGVTAILLLLALSPVRDWVLTATGRIALPEERKVAVLMFENLQGGPEQEAFCRGLTDSLTSAITQMGQAGGSLWVVPASEIRDGEVRSIREAKELFGVNLAITGSLRRLSDSTRVTLNLVDAERAKQMESRTIEVAAADLPSLEPKLVEAVAAML
ncbi:MAG: serine/threonine-protein kinase [Bryobacterales bacterium]|nr:serine/threonine-protein kinase [Bryobacterales bacterium]